jgi:hypothetical protein
MKFFSNDAKENSDDQYGRDHGDVVTSEPVAVPQQRAGSPWSDAPADASPSADGSRSDEDAAGSPDDELAEQEPRDPTGEEPADRRDETATVTTYHPDGTVETEDREDSAVRDEGTFDSPQAVEPATGEPLSSEPDSDPGTDVDTDSDPALRRDVADRPVEDQAIKDEGGFDSPQAVEPATGDPLETDSDDLDEPESDPALRRDVAEAPAEPGDTVAEEAPVAVAATAPAASATPGSVPAAPLDRLFSDGDSFAERFREIQLRFVDSPKEATADAAALVGEAVDKLTSALQAQKDALGGDSDDTEQLRVQLRSYRDLLGRLSAV